MGPAPNGWIGGLICLVAIYLPSFLLLMGILPFSDALRSGGAGGAQRRQRCRGRTSPSRALHAGVDECDLRTGGFRSGDCRFLAARHVAGAALDRRHLWGGRCDGYRESAGTWVTGFRQGTRPALFSVG